MKHTLVATMEDGPAVLVQVAQDEAPLQLARDQFGRELAMFLALLWAVLSAAAWLQVRLGHRPPSASNRKLVISRQRDCLEECRVF